VDHPEVVVNEKRASALVAAERARIEAALGQLIGDVQSEGPLQRQQTGEAYEDGTDLETEGVETALIDNLRDELAAVARAEERIAAGTFGRSIESGAPIPDERLEAAPLAERTMAEQLAHEQQ
jgi:DnaK suppressor protein